MLSSQEKVDARVDDTYGWGQWFMQTLILPLMFIERTTEARIARAAKDSAEGRGVQPAVVPAHIKEKLSCTTIEGAKCPIHVIAPRDASSVDVNIIYFHGGCYMFSFANPYHWDLAAALIEAAAGRARIFMVDYPLVPAVTHETLFDVIDDVYRIVVSTKGVEGKKLVLMGDSAGGGIALILAQRLFRAKKIMSSLIQQPDSLILLSPWLDVSMSAPEEELTAIDAKDPLLCWKGLRAAGKLLAGPNLDAKDPKVSPLFGSMEGIPPVSVWCGSHDVLVTDSRRLVKTWKDKRSISTLLRYREKTGLIHCYFVLGGAETTDTIAEIITSIEKDCSIVIKKREV